MNEMIEPRPKGQERAMAAVGPNEMTAVAGGTEYGTGGCATMWPKDKYGNPMPPRPIGSSGWVPPFWRA
jgi:hypothetical protein